MQLLPHFPAKQSRGKKEIFKRFSPCCCVPCLVDGKASESDKHASTQVTAGSSQAFPGHSGVSFHNINFLLLLLWRPEAGCQIQEQLAFWKYPWGPRFTTQTQRRQAHGSEPLYCFLSLAL